MYLLLVKYNAYILLKVLLKNEKLTLIFVNLLNSVDPSSSNTDGSFSMADSNSFFESLRNSSGS